MGQLVTSDMTRWPAFAVHTWAIMDENCIEQVPLIHMYMYIYLHSLKHWYSVSCITHRLLLIIYRSDDNKWYWYMPEWKILIKLTHLMYDSSRHFSHSWLRIPGFWAQLNYSIVDTVIILSEYRASARLRDSHESPAAHYPLHCHHICE